MRNLESVLVDFATQKAGRAELDINIRYIRKDLYAVTRIYLNHRRLYSMCSSTDYSHRAVNRSCLLSFRECR